MRRGLPLFGGPILGLGALAMIVALFLDAPEPDVLLRSVILKSSQL
jgi:hypothetical protein